MPKKGDPNIVLTGGHAATPALAVVDELKSRYPAYNLIWIGSKYSMPGSRTTTLEYKKLPELGVDFYSLIPGKIQTKFTRYTIPLLLSIPLSFLQALWFLIKLKPKVIISFGGFSSFPVIFWGWLMRIPTILHEQTVAAGRASRISAHFVNKIALAREESIKYFPKNKSVVTGNPIMKEVLSIKPKQTLGKVKRILVIGGSRGSEFINEEVDKIVPELTKLYKITHVTGERDYEKYKKKERENYKVLAYADPFGKRNELYEESDLIIGRAGASTISEILYIKRPAIIIPLPRTYMGEQYKNAESAEKFGIAKVMKEEEVNPTSLVSAVNQMFDDWQKIVDRVAGKLSPDAGAAQKIVNLIAQFLE